MLGHCHPSYGPLQLPVGKEVEIKIDYGTGYEKVRVRKNYPRVDKKEQERLQRQLMADGSTAIYDMYNCNAIELDDYIVFIRRLWRNANLESNMNINKRCRVLAVSLLMRVRALTVVEELEESESGRRHLQRLKILAKEVKELILAIVKCYPNGLELYQ